MPILVIGGAGYIGSHMVKRLIDEGEQVCVVDNLTGGHRDSILGGDFFCADFSSSAVLKEVFASHKVSAVMHFASHIQVGESVLSPGKYYVNNVANTLTLLNTMVECGVLNFIFSSSAAVYGDAGTEPVTEAANCLPVSPYGRTKRMVEEALQDFKRAYGLRFFSLRYFNAAGADPQARIGERHNPETHLVPLVLQAALGRRPDITIFGQDYPTPDGTCIRDYVHVEDLCEAHLLALRALQAGCNGGYFNLGNAQGYSVAEVINIARRITGRPIAVKDAPRRAGDPAILIADSNAIRRELGWKPARSDLGTIVEDAWRWEKRRDVVSML